jgi:predicted AAA+ superfamily ATPase
VAGLDSTKRILWRIQEEAKGETIVNLKLIRLAIMTEAGINPKTIREHISCLSELKCIKRLNRWQYQLLKKDLDFEVKNG